MNKKFGIMVLLILLTTRIYALPDKINRIVNQTNDYLLQDKFESFWELEPHTNHQEVRNKMYDLAIGINTDFKEFKEKDQSFINNGGGEGFRSVFFRVLNMGVYYKDEQSIPAMLILSEGNSRSAVKPMVKAFSNKLLPYLAEDLNENKSYSRALSFLYRMIELPEIQLSISEKKQLKPLLLKGLEMEVPLYLKAERASFILYLGMTSEEIIKHKMLGIIGVFFNIIDDGKGNEYARWRVSYNLVKIENTEIKKLFIPVVKEALGKWKQKEVVLNKKKFIKNYSKHLKKSLTLKEQNTVYLKRLNILKDKKSKTIKQYGHLLEELEKE